MNILYGVPSEGMGHATRSLVVIQYLISQNHQVKIVTSDRAYKFLYSHFGEQVIAIEGFHLAYKKAEVSIGKTILLNFKNAPKQLIKNFIVYQSILSDFKPDVVISDFESFSHLFAKANRIPLISIDNMQILNRATLDIHIPQNEKSNYLLARNIVKAKLTGANHYFISSFFYPPLRKNKSSYIAPIIREQIMHAKTKFLNHIVVYQTSATQTDMVDILQQIPNENFIVYGFNKEEVHGNVTLKSFSEIEFIQYFSTAKAVIANGGFSFISEAVFLKKPICCVPIKNQFEQFVNASYVDKLKYGRQFSEFNSDSIKSFLYDLPIFNKALSQYKHDENKALFNALDHLEQYI